MVDQTAYDRIKAALTIDPARLTEELVELPQLQSDAAEGVAEMQRIRDGAKDALENIKADAAAKLRYIPVQTKQRSETQIASEILLEDVVHEAQEALRDAEYNLAMWKAAADGMRAKNGALRVMADLIQSGYTTPTTIFSERRRKIDIERRQLRSQSNDHA